MPRRFCFSIQRVLVLQHNAGKMEADARDTWDAIESFAAPVTTSRLARAKKILRRGIRNVSCIGCMCSVSMSHDSRAYRANCVGILNRGRHTLGCIRIASVTSLGCDGRFY